MSTRTMVCVWLAETRWGQGVNDNNEALWGFGSCQGLGYCG